MTQKIHIGDLIVGEQFTYLESVYEVKRITRDGHQWPSPRWYYVGPPGNDGEECRLPFTMEVVPLAPVTTTAGVTKVGERVLDGQ